MDTETNTCRCGHSGDGPHPCHYSPDGVTPYSCGKPATHRFYGAHLTCLTGVQMKVGMHDTWACDDCWAKFQAQVAAQQAAKGT